MAIIDWVFRAWIKPPEAKDIASDRIYGSDRDQIQVV